MLGDALRAIDNHLSSDDTVRLNQVFKDGIKSNDLQSIYFSSLNLKDLSAQEKTDICSKLISMHGESKLNVSLSINSFPKQQSNIQMSLLLKEFEKNFYLCGASKLFACKHALPESILSAVKTSLTKDTTTAHELYYNYFAYKYAGNVVDEATKTRIAANLQTILKADDSLSK